MRPEIMNEPSAADNKRYGLYVLFGILGLFGTVIAVNITIAVLANKAWSGLVVKSSYVASQDFNTERARFQAQQHEGLSTVLSLEPGRVVVDFNGAAGDGGIDHLELRLGLVVNEAQDRVLVLERDAKGRYVAPIDLAPGLYEADLLGLRAGAQAYKRRLQLRVLTSGEARIL